MESRPIARERDESEEHNHDDGSLSGALRLKSQAMGSAMNETVDDSVEVGADVSRPALTAVVDSSKPSIERSHGRTRLLFLVARFAAVAVPVALVYALWPPAGAGAIGTSIALVTAIWFLALRATYAAARPSPLALGVPVTSALGTLGGCVFIPLLTFWLPGTTLRPLAALAMAGGVFAASVAVERKAARQSAFRRRVLIVGGSRRASQVARLLHERPELPFDLVGFVQGTASEPSVTNGVPIEDIVLRDRPDLVVLADSQLPSEAVDRLLDVASSGFRVVGLPEFYEHALGLVPVRAISPAWFVGVLHLYQRPSSQFTKRLFDIVLSSFGLLLAAPLMVTIGVLVRSSGPGPVVFRQTRVGKGGATFEMLKFRTMISGAEEAGTAVWAQVGDPRVTKVGRFLRRTRLDELPQLWNVLRSDMSLIGPRPERPEFLELLESRVPFWTRRNLVKPGVTGWAQVQHGYASGLEGTTEKLSYDLYYLKHRSLLLDVAIVLKTLPTLISGNGAR